MNNTVMVFSNQGEHSIDDEIMGLIGTDLGCCSEFDGSLIESTTINHDEAAEWLRDRDLIAPVSPNLFYNYPISLTCYSNNVCVLCIYPR